MKLDDPKTLLDTYQKAEQGAFEAIRSILAALDYDPADVENPNQKKKTDQVIGCITLCAAILMGGLKSTFSTTPELWNYTVRSFFPLIDRIANLVQSDNQLIVTPKEEDHA